MANPRRVGKRRSVRPLSRRTEPFAESVIREMTRVGEKVGGINLAQGLPDFEPPPDLSAALRRAVERPGSHQYTFPWGTAAFRGAIAKKYARFNGFSPDPDREITVTCGVSEAAVAAIFALTEPGDEVVILEPWYENYVPACVLAGVRPRFVPLEEPEFRLDADRLARAFNRKTRLILVNTPGNPSGRVFRKDELTEIARLCARHGVVAVVDEIYEHIWSEGHSHLSLASLPGMRDRTVTISGLGKTYAVTGWRVGWAVAAPALSALIRKVHDYLTICAPAPLQEAGCTALALPESYYETLRATYARRRTILLDALARSGLAFAPPEGAYYVMADARSLGWRDDRAFVDFLIRQVGVVAVPGSSFYAGGGGRTRARFNFAKCEETLHEAAKRMTTADLRVPRARR